MVDWNLFSRIGAFSGLFLALAFATISTAKAADAERGKKLYQQCITCHGKNGQGKVSQNAPRIAGQYDWYILTALKDFKSGARKNPPMMPYIQDLTETDLKDLAAYISTLQIPKQGDEKNSEE